MKKLLTFLCAGVLMSAACVACDKTNDSVDGIEPIKASDAVISFFEEHTNNLSLGDKTPTCLLINSAKEFAKIVPPSTALPTIDFNSYTLVVGQHVLGSPGYLLKNQSVDKRPMVMKLTLIYERMGGASPAIMTTFYSWALYPKLPQKPIEIKITYVN
jgi:hypothetical protein